MNKKKLGLGGRGWRLVDAEGASIIPHLRRLFWVNYTLRLFNSNTYIKLSFNYTSKNHVNGKKSHVSFLYSKIIVSFYYCTITLTINIFNYVLLKNTKIWYFKSIYRDKSNDISYANNYLYIVVIKYDQSILYE
jgi:hypothetical protein